MKKTILVLAAAVAVAGTVSAQDAGENIFRYRVGDFEVVLLSDGQSRGNARVFSGTPSEVTAPYLDADGSYATATNAFAVVTPKEVLLIDAGVGRALEANLAAAGIDRPGAIWLTHMHGDHIGGLLRNGERAFPGVPLSLGAVEAEYWAQQGGNAGKVLEVYEPRTLKLLKPEDVPAGRDGVFPVEAYGHTPGHTAFLVVSDGEKLLVWGDLAHSMAVQMPRPEITVSYDVDPGAARASRLRLLEYAAQNDIPVAGMHVPYPGVGMVEKAGEGYKFTPVKN